ncbi:MAG TPA: hypothetical protein VIL87_05285 [Dermatophilaceae bacterium]|jgi:hypothetical protein
MTTIDTTETEHQLSIWENISWRIGYRTNMLGEYLVKLSVGSGMCRNSAASCVVSRSMAGLRFPWISDADPRQASA